ncbi:MAG: metallophosphoesterase [Candidatus Sumerlaeia bacterium]|nr:metallophosphoesterase [Candidatus Sumerlaeia bacterium]
MNSKGGFGAHAVLLTAVLLPMWLMIAAVRDIAGFDQGLYLQVARELAETWRLSALTYLGETYAAKPPLAFAIYALMLELTGGRLVEWVVRLPAVLSSLGIVLLTLSIARRFLSPRGALVAALLLATLPQFANQVFLVRLDTQFTLWIMAALWCVLGHDWEGPLPTARAAALWVFLFLAVWTKGPLALVVVGAAPAYEAWRRRSAGPLKALRPLLALPLLVAPLGLWIARVAVNGGGGVVKEVAGKEVLGRLVGGSHLGPPWYYIERFFTEMTLPFGLLLVPAVWALWKARREDAARLRPVLAWAVLPFLFLCIVPGKRATYMLPLFPAVAILVAWWLDEVWLAAERAGRAPKAAGGTLLLLGVLVAGASAVMFEYPAPLWYFDYFPTDPVLGLLVGTGVALALAGARLLMPRVCRWTTLKTAIAALLLMHAVYFGPVRASRDLMESSRAFAPRLAERLREASLPLVVGAVEKASRPMFHLYGDYQIRKLPEHPSILVEPDSLPGILVVRGSDLSTFGGEDAFRAAGFELIYRGNTMDKTDMAAFQRASTLPQDIPESLSFALAGDAGTGDFRQENIGRQMAASHDADPFDALVLLGDNIYGEDEPWEEMLDQYFLRPFAPILERGVPVVTALGNHDVSSGKREGFLTTPIFNLNGRGYHTTSYGDFLHFFIIDSEFFAKDSQQVRWLLEELAWHPRGWRFLISHHPIENTGGGGDEGSNEKISHAVQSVIDRSQPVHAVLSGHVHVYMRLWNSERSIPQIINGNAGELEDDEPIPPNERLVAAYKDSAAFVRLDIEGTSLTGTVIAEDGRVVDRFRLSVPTLSGYRPVVMETLPH